MTTVNALSVALFNAAPGGYSADMAKNPAAYAGAVGAVLEKDLSTDAAFVDHVLGNFGIASTNALFAEAKAAMMGLVTAQGRALATTSAINFLAGVPRTDKYAGVADAFFAKVNTATAFSTANPRELDVSKLIAAVTGVDTDVVATNAAFAAGAASRDSEVGALRVDVAKLQADLKASQDAAAAAATKAAADAAAAKTAADAAAAAAKTAADAAAAKAAADLKAAQDAATAAATKAAADLKAANDKIAVIDDTSFPSESAAAAAAKAAAEAAAATAAAAAKTAADAAAAKAAADLKAAQDQITALQNPAGGTFALTTSTSDLLIGRGNADQFTGTSTTDDAGDIIVDAATGDNDTLTLTTTGAVPALRTINVENIVVNMNSLAADAVDAANFAGVTGLTVTRGDVTVGGATLTGEKTVTVNNMNAANVAAVTAGTGTTDVVVAQATIAGATINANNASGNVTVTGAATINATGAGTGDTVTVNVLGVAAQDARAVNVTTGAATVTIGAFTGSITVNAPTATTVTLANASGGATVNSTTGATTANGIDVRGIDASGATITTGSYLSTAAGTIDIGGTALTTDTATISAAGTINLDVGVATGAVDILSLQSNGAAVTYNIVSTFGVATTYTGEADVTIAGNVSEFSGTTATTFATIDLNAGTAGAIDADSWTVSKVDLGFDNQGNTITVTNAQTWEITADQTTGLDYDFATTTVGDLTIIAGDDNGDNTAVGTITVAALNAAAGAATTTGTVTIEASIANFTATSTVLGAAQTLVVTGDEDVTLGAVTARAVNAANSTGIIDLTAAANVATVTTGSGADVVVINDATGGGAVVAHTVSTGAGNDTITVTSTAATATIDAGAGNDTLTLTGLTAYVAIGGAGNDTFRTGADINAFILGGDGTDTFTITTGTLNFSDNTQFALNSIEAINLTAATGITTISSAQLAANPTFAITADGDQLTVAVGTAAGALDASGVTIAAGSTAVLNYTGNTGANVMTGGVQNETFQGGRGADSIEGGNGTDTFVLEGVTTETGSANASIGMVVNLSSSAVSAATIVSNVANTFLGGSATSVAAGTATHLYDEVAALNANTVDLLSGIENITGGAGADYIVGSADNNVIVGGAGVDYINAGDGDDTVSGTMAHYHNIAEIVVGGAGTDTISITDGGAVSFAAATITGFEALTVAADAGADAIVIDQGFFDSGAATTTATLTITGGADADNDTFTITAGVTAWDVGGAEANAADVNAAGEYHLADVGDNGVLTYFDEVGATVVTLTIVGLDDGAVALAGGNLVFTA